MEFEALGAIALSGLVGSVVGTLTADVGNGLVVGFAMLTIAAVLWMLDAADRL